MDIKSKETKELKDVVNKVSKMTQVETTSQKSRWLRVRTMITLVWTVMLTAMVEVVKHVWLGTISAMGQYKMYTLGQFPSTNTYYAKARMGRHEQLMLLDTGCTHSVISPDSLKKIPKEYVAIDKNTKGQCKLADGSQIHLTGSAKINMKIGSQMVYQDFLITNVSDHPILGMDFFHTNHCELDFSKLQMRMNGHPIHCCDIDGRKLVMKVQVRKTTKVAPESEMIIEAHLSEPATKAPGVVEYQKQINGLMIASTLHQPKEQCIYIRVMNITKQPITIQAGKVVASYTQSCEIAKEEDAETVATCKKISVDTDELVHSNRVPEHLQSLAEQGHELMSPQQKQRYIQTLLTYRQTFSVGDADIGKTEVIKHHVTVKPGTAPIKQRPYRYSPVQQEEIDKQVADLYRRDIIEPGKGAWSSPIVLVKKKDGKWRFCLDYRKINDCTVKDAYTLPRIDDSLDALGGNEIFSCLDLVSGYWQVAMDDESKEMTAFSTRSGLHQFKVMPFGLTNAPATFERLMESVMRNLQWKTLLIYLDDIIIFSKDMDTHLDRFEEVLQRLTVAGLKLKPSKCTLFAKQVEYLGHIISDKGVGMDPTKVSAVENWPTPKHVTDVRSFLGTTSYYRRHIAGYANLSKPLTMLTQKDIKFNWTETCEQAFQQLKNALVTGPILCYPDYKEEFWIDTDASNDGIGAVLYQKINEVDRVVAYYSKQLNKAERNYCVTRKELLAVVKAVKHFRNYVYGVRFHIQTDHASLIWLLKKSEPCGQVARWMETLSAYNYTINYKKGSQNGSADGLSRQKCSNCRQCDRHFASVTAKLNVLQCTSEMAKLQQEDVDLLPIIQTLQTQYNPTPDERKEESQPTFQLRKILEHLDMQNDVLVIKSYNEQSARNYRVICPRQKQQEVIQQLHEQAHFGVQKTIAMVRQDWYWPGLTATVRRYVKTCEACQQAKHHESKKKPSGHHLYAGRPWSVVGVDLLGPLEKSHQGNTMLLVLTDHFTRWSDAIPLPDAKATTIVKALENSPFYYFGAPDEIHTDRGKQFLSTLFKECCEIWRAKKTQTCPYRAQANSVVERLNRTIGNSLRALLIENDDKDWDLYIPQLMKAVRASPHRITGETANFLMFGREVKLPHSLVMDRSMEPSYTSTTEYAKKLENTLHKAYQAIRDAQIKVRDSDTEEPSIFRKGDMVWLQSKFFKPGKTHKLQAKYHGPYDILKALPYHSYVLSRKGKTTIQHEGRMKLYYQPPSTNEASRDIATMPTPTRAAPHTTSRSGRTVKPPGWWKNYNIE